jgi:hypothetical protein
MGGGGAGAGALLVLIALYMLRRRLPLALLALALSCKKEPLPVVTMDAQATATPPAMPPQGPPTKAEKARDAMGILEGRFPGGTLGVVAGRPVGEKHQPRGNIDVGPVSADAQRVVNAGKAGFRACYTVGLRSDPNMRGKLVLALKIQPGGEVESASVATNTGLAPSVAACCAARARRLQFAPRSEAWSLHIPLAFVHED